MAELLDIGILMAKIIKASVPATRVKKGLMELTTIAKIKNFYALMQELGLLRFNTRAFKDNKISKIFRESGNKLFSKGLKSMTAAMQMYNKAICWAEPNNGDELAIAYANRSAVLFEWKEYQLCRDNIRLAKDNGYPERLKQKLDNRDAECVTLLNTPTVKAEKPLKLDLQIERTTYTGSLFTDVDPMYSYDKYRCEPVLSLMPNPKIPLAANCLEVKYDSEHGPHIVTNEDLKPGQIVVIENPYVHALCFKDDYRYTKCANCYEENFLSLIPCMSCSTTMFCSEKCLDESKHYHDLECPLSDFIFNTGCWRDLLILRMIWKAYRSFHSTSLLNDFCKTQNESKGWTFSGDDDMNDEKKYRQVYGSVNNKQESLEDYCKAAFLYHMLTRGSEFVQFLKTEDDHNVLMELLMRHIQIVKLNSILCCQYKDFDMSDAGDDKSAGMYSRGIYQLSSLFKHSCAPNISIVSIGAKIIVYCSRVIKKGSQLFRCYGGCHYFQHDKSRRQEMLLELFSLRCNCEACTKNYPANYQNIREESLPTKYDILLGTYTSILDIEIKNFDEILEVLEMFDNKLPCLSLNVLQLRLHKIMKLKYGDISTNLKIAFKFHPLAVAMKV